MSKICKITNKKPMSGNKVSDSNIKNKRWFKINIFKKKIYDQNKKKWIKLKISSYALRLIKKIGLNNAIKKYKKCQKIEKI
ncbi:MAG: 50S ribosomal protein L28 [Candidatus Shikimatogenerans bostrichidophilus]|nr:MAG: 50S ribosomal protein L28 [Candidatus Shikimatogenerans bostrichidophilus]